MIWIGDAALGRMRREIEIGGGDLWSAEDRPKDIAKIIVKKSEWIAELECLRVPVIIVGRLVGEWLGGVGAIISAAVVGLVDVDAITVSLAGLTPRPLDIQAATIAILSAVATNTLSKIAIGGIIGRGRFALEIIAMALACLTVGALALWMTLAILHR